MPMVQLHVLHGEAEDFSAAAVESVIAIAVRCELHVLNELLHWPTYAVTAVHV